MTVHRVYVFKFVQIGLTFTLTDETNVTVLNLPRTNSNTQNVDDDFNASVSLFPLSE